MSDTNLADVFGPAAAARPANGLAGRLPPRSTTTPATRPTNPPPPVAPPVADPVARTVSAPRPAQTAPDVGTKQITVYVLPHIPEAIKAAKSGRTNAGVVYDAIESLRPRLTDLVTARQTPQNPAGALFARSTEDVATEGARITWTFKTTPGNRKVLDQLVVVHGASSRSELVSVALEAAYPPPEARPA